MSVKGDWYRPHSTTKEERALRERYAEGGMSFRKYERAYRKLIKQSLIKRNGKVIK